LCSFGVWVEWCKGQGVEKSQASVWAVVGGQCFKGG